SEYGAELGTPLAADLAGKGWVAWNLEYRRVGNGGGWPATFQDVSAGVDELASIAAAGAHGRIDISRVVAIGHSAGGQLAAWLAGRLKPQPPDASRELAPVRARGTGTGPVSVTGVISQAGVLDLKGAAESGVGGTAVADLLGGTFEQVPGRFRVADPTQQLPIGVPVHCVHAKDDRIVPFRQSSAYVDAAKRAGDPAVLHSLDGDHFTLVDPSSAAWRTVTDLLPTLLRS
ncbi:MAG: alpha/beta hydrolase family protein, partial [Nakamurella sp.]